MTSGFRPVKKLAVSLLTTLAICTAAIAPAAFAIESPLTETTVTVKFKLTDLEAENGVQTIYAKLKKRASSFCRADKNSLIYLRQSQKDCTNDLMDQFIENAGIDSLKAYHVAQNAQPIMKIATF